MQFRRQEQNGYNPVSFLRSQGTDEITAHLVVMGYTTTEAATLVKGLMEKGATRLQILGLIDMAGGSKRRFQGTVMDFVQRLELRRGQNNRQEIANG